jgi:hypothetical protein
VLMDGTRVRVRGSVNQQMLAGVLEVLTSMSATQSDTSKTVDRSGLPVQRKARAC